MEDDPEAAEQAEPPEWVEQVPAEEAEPAEWEEQRQSDPFDDIVADDQVPPDEPYEFLLTSSRLDTSAGNVPETVSVIEDDEVEAIRPANADDLVRNAAAVAVRRPQGPSNIFPHVLQIRGVSGIDRVLVLLDGLPLNDALSGAANLNLLPTERVQRIEIIRGPYSALWGSYAMGGVINVLTKPGDQDPGATLTASVGPDESARLSASAAGALSSLELSSSYDYQTSENYLAAEGEQNLDYLHHRALFRLDAWRGEPLSAVLTGGLFYSDTGFNQYVDLRGLEGLDFYLRNEGRSEKDNQFARLALAYRAHPDLSLQLAAGIMNQWSTFFTIPIPLEGNVPSLELYRGTYDARQWRVEGSGRWRFTSWGALVLGLDQVWDEGGWENTDLDDRHLIEGMTSSASISAGYGQLEFDLADNRLRIIGGTRLDRHSTFGLALSPKGGLSYEPIDGTIFRAAGGRAFRSPSLMELYSPPWLRIPPYYTEGNQELEPETLWSVDGGIEQRLPFDLSARLTGFWVEAENQITFELQPDNTERYINSDGYRTLGLEAALHLPQTGPISSRLGYSYTWTEDFATGEPIIYVPAHLFSCLVTAEATLGSWLLSGAFDLRAISSRWYANPRAPENRKELDGYLVANLHAGARHGPLSFFFDIRNLTDAEYEETNGLMSPRFSFLLGARMEMDGWEDSF
ncbi:MAG: TonB-dependent receptor [Bradymonadales bacterium]|nr:TonB-dependent receptor [Bradymonadales bacterium]